MMTLHGLNAIDGITWEKGAYINNSNSFNGVQGMIMQSSENADNVIADFEEAIAKGYNPNFIIDQILENRGLTEADFTDSDILRINRKVESIYKMMNQKGYK